MAMDIRTKRVYDPADPADGARILVDRLWPRGVTKERAHLTAWMKDIAPSPALREQFCHMDEQFDDFALYYRKELAENPAKQALVAELRQRAAAGPVTLLYATKSPTQNQAVVLRNYLLEA